MSRLGIIGAAVLMAMGCQTAPQAKATQPAGVDAHAVMLNEGYSLLYELCGKEKDVDKAMWLHKVDPRVEAVVKEIAQASAAAKARFEAFAAADPALRLKMRPLPKLEVSTRDAIEATQTRLLMTAGDAFELRLLLTQTDSMQYGSHMAKVLAAQDANAERKAYLEGLSKKLDQFRDRVVALLEVVKEQGKK
ncbi:MAG: hypothetical protein K8S99_11580 [Planctomycetes bacterium]|nr:hypothetical protein [Planctomycetota bacterium]